MLHFYFGLLCSFRIVFFRNPSELFPFLCRFLKLLELLLLLMDSGQVLFPEAAGFVWYVLYLAEPLWTWWWWLLTMLREDKGAVYVTWSGFKKSLEPHFFIPSWKFAVYKQTCEAFPQGHWGRVTENCCWECIIQIVKFTVFSFLICNQTPLSNAERAVECLSGLGFGSSCDQPGSCCVGAVGRPSLWIL